MKTPVFFSPAEGPASQPFITIQRAASSQDYSNCADIWLAASLAGHDFVPASFWHEQRAVMEQHYLPSSQVLLLTANGEPAGFAAKMQGEAPYLAGLFVLPQWWGKGFGRQLLEQVLAELSCQNNASLRCSVYEKNCRALAFYTHMGFAYAGSSLCPHTHEPQKDLLWTAASNVYNNAGTICRP